MCALREVETELVVMKTKYRELETELVAMQVEFSERREVNV